MKRLEGDDIFVGFRFHPDLHHALKVTAAEKSTTMSAIVRKAIRDYTDVHKKMRELKERLPG